MIPQSKAVHSILACALSSVIASSAFALDLQEAYALAQQQDANYTAAIARYEAAKLDLPLAKTGRRPNLTATGGLTHNYDKSSPDEGEDASGDALQSQLGLNLSQRLYNKSTRHDIQAADLAVNIAALQLGIAGEGLIAETVDRYLGVLSALDNQALAELERTAIEKQLDLATQRLNVGLGTKTDQFDAKARFESSNASLIAAKNEVQDARQALEALMNQTIPAALAQEMSALDNDKVDLALEKDQDWAQLALENNRVYLITQHQVDLQQIEVARASDGRSPTLDLVAGASVADSGAGIQPGGRQENWNVGLRAAIPVYLGGAIKLQQQKAGYGLNAAKADAEQARRDTNRTAQSAYRGVEALQRQVQALAQAVFASESALESKQEGFKAGVTTNLDVLDGQRDLFRARRDHLKVSYDLVNAVVNLERAAGRLDDEDVTRINGWLK